MFTSETELESWSYLGLTLAEHDANGKFKLNKTSKKRKSKCPLGKKIVASPFFRSVVYHVDFLIHSARDVCERRRRDLDEFDQYVNDEQTDEDHDYRQELAREIIYWEKMISLYQTIRQNKTRWMKEGKFPWSGVKISTPYFEAPSIRLSSKSFDGVSVDNSMTPVDADKAIIDFDFKPITKN